jgi:hypothetical protein
VVLANPICEARGVGVYLLPSFAMQQFKRMSVPETSLHDFKHVKKRLQTPNTETPKALVLNNHHVHPYLNCGATTGRR